MEEKVKKEKIEEIKLNPKVWDVPYNADLVAQVLYVLNSNERKGTSSVKGRGDVSGGGKKPWKQKGTGRARQGSIRSPLWVGGGVAFGPNIKNWKRKVNKKMSKEAICIVLSERNRNDAVKVVDINSKGEIKSIREKMEKNILKSTLVISDIQNLKLAVRNIKGVNIADPMKVNVKDVVKRKAVVIDKDSVNKLENRLLNGK